MTKMSVMYMPSIKSFKRKLWVELISPMGLHSWPFLTNWLTVTLEFGQFDLFMDTTSSSCEYDSVGRSEFNKKSKRNLHFSMNSGYPAAITPFRSLLSKDHTRKALWTAACDCEVACISAIVLTLVADVTSSRQKYKHIAMFFRDIEIFIWCITTKISRQIHV